MSNFIATITLTLLILLVLLFETISPTPDMESTEVIADQILKFIAIMLLKDVMTLFINIIRGKIE